jgi:hypothetical protein
MSEKKIPKAPFSFGRYKKPTPNESVADRGFVFGRGRSALLRNTESHNSVQSQTLENGSEAAEEGSD